MIKWDLFEIDDDDDISIEEYYGTYSTLLEAVIEKDKLQKYNDNTFRIKVRYDD